MSLSLHRVIAITAFALAGCGGSAGDQVVQTHADAGASADVDPPESGALPEASADVVDAGRDAADSGVDAPVEVGAAPEAGVEAGGGDDGDDGALAACIEHACDDANPGQGGANCGVLTATCGGQPVDCSAWQGASSGGCSPSLPTGYVCGGGGVANQCGNACESTSAYTAACSSAYLPNAWAVSGACDPRYPNGPLNPVPYTIAGGVVTWRSQPVTVGCTGYANNGFPIYCCD